VEDCGTAMVTRRSSKEKPGKQSRVKLTESKELAQALMQSAGTGIYIVQDGKFQYVNSLFLEETGYTEGELLGTHSLDLVHPEDREIVRRKAIENLKSHSSFPYEYRFMKKNGEVGWVLERVTSAEYKGKPATIGSFMNITGWKLAEEELKYQRKYFQALFESSPEAVVSLDMQSRVIDINPAFKRIFGYSMEDIGGKYFLDYVLPESKQEEGRGMMRMAQRGEVITSESIRKRADGTEIPVSILATSIMLDGKQRGTFAIYRDITERKKVEEALRDSEEFNSSLLSNSPNPIVVVNPDTSIRYVNPALEKLTGFSSSELIGAKAPYPWWTEETLRKTSEDFGEALHQGVRKVEELFQKRGGQQFWVEVTATPANQNEQLKYYIANWVDITERKKAEEELKYQRKYFQALFEGSPEAVVSIDMQIRVMDMNPAFKKLFGYTLEDMGGKDILDYILPKGKREEASSIIGIAQSGKVVTAESIRKRADGTEIPVSILSAPIILDGKPIGIFGIYRDITERKKAEKRIEHLNLVLRAIRNVNQLITREKERERLLKGICDNLIETRGYYNAWVALLDGSGRLITAAEAGLGKDFLPMVEQLRSGELIVCGQRALTQSDVVVTNDPTSTCTNCPLAKKYSGRGAMTVRLEHAGRVYGLLSASAPANFLIDAEESSLFEEVARDIAFALHSMGLEEERKRGEEALRESEEKYRTLTENINVGIYRNTPGSGGKFIEVNPALIRMFGYENREEFLVINAADVYQNSENRLKFSEKMLRDGFVRNEELQLKKRDGALLIGSVSAAAVKDEKGNVKYYDSIIEDITERKRAEEEREALLEELEKINRKLEQSNKELQDFAYIASHDLREPLRKISSFGTLLQNSLKGKTDEDQQEDFEFMIDGANRMQEMIDDLLNYSRLTTRAKPPERVDLNEVIKDLRSLELATLLDETKGSIHVPKLLPPVQGDPSQMHQLLQNLIGNGLKFHREGIAPEISIRAHRIEGKMVWVEVQDNGIGIGEEYQEQVFTMFKRLHSRAQYKGTGIGLAVCKKIVERHGGNIEIKSASGEGSTFWFTLPRASYSGNNW